MPTASDATFTFVHTGKAMPKLSRKNQITIPVDVLREAGLGPGDELRVRAAGRGRVEVERWSDLVDQLAGSLPAGTYPPGYLEGLRSEWER
jgi:bifunctional DNA-binding transcriptional regulator/antitoxin component of YhaV-PrlF toxin-antitoxin module